MRSPRDRTSAWLLLAALALLPAPPAAAQDDTFREALAALPQASFAEKEALVDRLAATGHRSVQAVLGALLDGRLYARRDDGEVLIVGAPQAGGVAVPITDPVSSRNLGTMPEADLTRIGTNNRLRRHLRITVARFALSSADPAVRLDAVSDIAQSLDAAAVELLRARRSDEDDRAVLREIDTALALAALDGADTPARLEAVATLRSRLAPDVRNRLAALLEVSDGGEFVEPDPEVRRAAAAAVQRIDLWRQFYAGVETLFFGLSLGSVLVLVAIGLAITFGVMGVINMAHGELMMLGAYTTYAVQLAMPNHISASILVAVPAAFLVAGLAGVVLERTVIRFLYGRPLETLLATFGVSLVLQQAVRSLFSANNRAIETPAWLSGTVQINGALALTWNRIYIVAFTLVVFALLLLVLQRTRLGLHIRAVAQNRAMARAMGINSGRVDALTFGLGSGIAGVAGVALSQLTNVGPNLGQAYIVDAFMVVVFGGVGNLWGTLIGGMSLGMINKLLEPYAGAVLGKIVVLVALVIFIQRRPRGLFPQTGRAAESLS